jgi:hypothetical protein
VWAERRICAQSNHWALEAYQQFITFCVYSGLLFVPSPWFFLKLLTKYSSVCLELLLRSRAESLFRILFGLAPFLNKNILDVFKLR